MRWNPSKTKKQHKNKICSTGTYSSTQFELNEVKNKHFELLSTTEKKQELQNDKIFSKKKYNEKERTKRQVKISYNIENNPKIYLISKKKPFSIGLNE